MNAAAPRRGLRSPSSVVQAGGLIFEKQEGRWVRQPLVDDATF